MTKRNAIRFLTLPGTAITSPLSHVHSNQGASVKMQDVPLKQHRFSRAGFIRQIRAGSPRRRRTFTQAALFRAFPARPVSSSRKTRESPGHPSLQSALKPLIQTSKQNNHINIIDFSKSFSRAAARKLDFSTEDRRAGRESDADIQPVCRYAGGDFRPLPSPARNPPEYMPVYKRLLH